jgi:glucose/arabinose dehydrogenase
LRPREWLSTPATASRHWRGDLFVGALRDQMLVRLKLDGSRVVRQEQLLKADIGRIRDVRNGPDGFIYLLTDSPRGVIARLEPAR